MSMLLLHGFLTNNKKHIAEKILECNAACSTITINIIYYMYALENIFSKHDVFVKAPKGID